MSNESISPSSPITARPEWPASFVATFKSGEVPAEATLIRRHDVDFPGADHGHQILVVRRALSDDDVELAEQTRDAISNLVGPDHKETQRLEESISKREVFALYVNCDVNGASAVNAGTESEILEEYEKFVTSVNATIEAEKSAASDALQQGDLDQGLN